MKRRICSICLAAESVIGVIYHDDACPHKERFPDVVS